MMMKRCALLALAATLTLLPARAEAAMTLDAYNRLRGSEDGEAALRWYFSGLRDALVMFEDYEAAANRLSGRPTAKVQHLYCIDDDITLSVDLLRDFTQLKLEQTDPAALDRITVGNAVLEQLQQTFPCD
jgi:hypothetical protein